MNKSMKPSAPLAKSAEAAKQQRMAFFAQKREMLYINALVGLLNNKATDVTKIEDNVKLAVSYADESFKALYIANEEKEQEAGE